MTVSKKQITTLLLLLGLIVGIFLTIYLVKQRQEIRPRALQGNANLLLSAGITNPKVGDSFDVLISLQLTDASLQVSGADIVLLYDKSRLQVVNFLPQVPSVDPNAAFTDAPIVTYGGVFDDTYNFARVSLVARKTTANLAKGTVSLARVTFRALNTGTATIKFPDDDSLLQVVGFGPWTPTVIPPSVTPNISLTPTPTGRTTVGLWHMDEVSSGNVVIDSSGNGNTGIPTGTTVVAGKLGNARSFNGSSDYIQVGSATGLSPASQVSVGAWVKTNGAVSAVQSIYDRLNSAQGYGLYLDNTGKPALSINGGAAIATSSIDIDDSNWHFIVGTYNKDVGGTTQAKVYVDGVLTGTANYSTAINYSTEPRNQIGRMVTSSYFNGIIDEVSISNTALSAEQILAIFQAQNVTPTPTPTGTPVLSPTPSVTPAGGVNVHGFIFKEITPNGFKGPDETVLSGASLKIEKLEGDGTYTDKGTVISDNENVVKNFTFYGMTAGSYKIDPPQVTGYTIENCGIISNPIPTPLPWFSNVGNYFYCLKVDGSYKLQQWISTSQYQPDADNLFNVGNQDVGVDFPMRPAQ